MKLNIDLSKKIENLRVELVETDNINDWVESIDK